MALKIKGTTTNTNPGPPSGSIPKANKAGNMARPAKIATPCSNQSNY